MNDTATLTKKCGSCQLYGVIDGGDVVPYGSTTARLPEYYGCMEEHDGNEDGEPVDTSNCTHYKELPRCPKHPKEYITYRGGCAECEHEFYKEANNDR